MNGILLIDKASGTTSAEVVRRVKRASRTKVGHLGTLDPFATGLLPLCLGEATKIAQFLNLADKRYEGVIQLGWSTDTGDPTGRRTRAAAVPPLDPATLAAVAARFTGVQWQTPPMYSALKRGGVPLYRLARQGIEVERERRRVELRELILTAEGADRLRFSVGCSKGTYIRVLAEDIGAALGSAAHLGSLRRTTFGHFALEAAVPLETWERRPDVGLVSIRAALAHLPTVVLPEAAAEAARHGQAQVLEQVPVGVQDTAVLVDRAGSVAAVVVRSEQGGWAYARVLAPPPNFTSPRRCVSSDG